MMVGPTLDSMRHRGHRLQLQHRLTVSHGVLLPAEPITLRLRHDFCGVVDPEDRINADALIFLARSTACQKRPRMRPGYGFGIL